MEPTQDRLLDIAAKLFAEQGYSGVSMRRIAAQAGITQAAIYHHFPGKEALYFAAVRRLHEGRAARFQAGLDVSGTPQQRVARLVMQMLELVESDAHFRRIYFRELIEADDRRLRELVTNIFADMAAVLEEQLAELAPALDSRLLMLSLAGLIFHHVEARQLGQFLPGARPEQATLPVLAQHITALLLNGVQSK